MAINVNHAANSSVNHHWERKQACAFRKANSFMRKPPRSLALDDTSISLPRKLSRGKKKTILEGYTTWAVLHKGQAAREHVVALVRVTLKNNRVFFLFFPTQPRVYETGLLEPQKPTWGPAFSSNTCTLMWHDKILVALAQSHARPDTHTSIRVALTLTHAGTCGHIYQAIQTNFWLRQLCSTFFQ